MSSDQTLTRLDSEVSTKSDGAAKILSEQTGSDIADLNNRSQVAADSAAMVASATIPDLQISGLDSVSNVINAPSQEESPVGEFFDDLRTVAIDVGTGMLDEVTQHPLEVLEAGVVGFGIGIVATAAITAAAVLIAPEAAVAGVVIAAGLGVAQLISHVPDFIHDASVVSNEEDFSAEEVAQSHDDLQGVGKGTTLLLAGVAGGLATGLVSSAVESTVADVILPKMGFRGLIDDVAPGATAADAPAALKVADSEAPSTVNADVAAKAKTAEVADPLPAAPLTVERSVEINQSLFRASQEEVVPSVKQLYQVRFEKAGPGGQFVRTLENPDGVQVPEGQWMATRLNADGTPNIERGMVNTWTPPEKAILKGYKLTPEELAENTNITGWTNVDAPPVHMVQLKEAIDIETPWGPMHGDAGSWLANYDYNPLTGAPGSNYAIVTEQSYAATYKPV